MELTQKALAGLQLLNLNSKFLLKIGKLGCKYIKRESRGIRIGVMKQETSTVPMSTNSVNGADIDSGSRRLLLSW